MAINALPVVVATNGLGWPVTIASNGLGLPITQSSKGFGVPIVIVASGGYPVVEIAEVVPVAAAEEADDE